MARTSSSKNVSAPTAPYRLRLPPAGRPISPIAVVARGRRTSLQPRSRFATSPSSPTPTEPDSPSAPLQEKQGLKRTYSFLRPTYATPFDANTVVPPAANPNHHQHTSSHSITVPQHEAHSAAPTHAGTMTELSPPSTPVQHTPANQPNDIYSSPVESSPITGIELGLRGLFRSIDTTVLPIFEAPMQFDNFVYLKLQLENPDGGLTPFQFCNMTNTAAPGRMPFHP
ncbi:hypothetical protein BDZ94DRAFT_1327720 [Collybia nuda]|uniref:Uncharacterized protein n=1 Tax=Collybia nuda TaxID=64659 RepID=A0A9P5XSZ0_9AGAR|nr:hypothetical protein BDZ94DRAFT_1327720 [Collybia nuda]